MGSYRMQVNSESKTFEVQVEGSFSQQDAMSFIAEYDKEVAAFPAREYVINLDCTTLNVSTPDVLPMLEQCYLLYKQTGFAKVVFTIQKNPILKMQLNRVARTTGLENYDIIEV